MQYRGLRLFGKVIIFGAVQPSVRCKRPISLVWYAPLLSDLLYIVPSPPLYSKSSGTIASLSSSINQKSLLQMEPVDSKQ